jgi:hypothetical protein
MRGPPMPDNRIPLRLILKDNSLVEHEGLRARPRMRVAQCFIDIVWALAFLYSY